MKKYRITFGDRNRHLDFQARQPKAGEIQILHIDGFAPHMIGNLDLGVWPVPGTRLKLRKLHTHNDHFLIIMLFGWCLSGTVDLGEIKSVEVLP